MKRFLLVVAMLCLAVTASAVMDVPSQGWDGALNITANTTIDLSQAITGTWDTQPAGYVAGKGIYDPEKWAIVFHYTSVTVASGVTLQFTNHPANPPVVWLVEQTVQINGTVYLAGKDQSGGGEILPGPGGFRGGRGRVNGPIPAAGGGFGPGGGFAGSSAYNYGSAAGYATVGGGSATVPGGGTYGNAAVIPLIGGSGGGGRFDSAIGGGGGGGALMVGAQSSITINGTVNVIGGRGGTGGGSGGAFRAITPIISGSGWVYAYGGGSDVFAGGLGRIRIEANTQNLGSLGFQPAASVVDPGDTPQFWQDSSTPSVRIVSINGISVTSSPQGSLVYPNQDVSLNGAGDVTVVLEAMNVPTNGTIQVFIVKQGGARTALPTGSVTLIDGSTALSMWQAVFPAVTNGMYAVQARAVLP